MRLSVLIILLFLILPVDAQQSDFVCVNFKKADSIAGLCQNMSLKNLPLLVHKLTAQLNTQVEKFRAIHTWVCYNIESDHRFGKVTLNKRRKLKNDSVSFSIWNSRVQSKVFQRLLIEQKTICSGYAYLIKELTSFVNIECKIIDGYSRTVYTNVGKVDIPNHSWNAVKLNDKWYFIDATLASGYFDVTENKFVKNYNDGYFLASPELFSKNHYPLDGNWLLLEQKLTLKQFVNAPLIYGNTYKHNIIPVFPNKLETVSEVGDEVVFRFKISKEKISDFKVLFNDGQKSNKIEKLQSNYKNGILELKYRFIKKGFYNVHAKIDNDVVASYTIKIVKPKAKVI